MMWVRVVFSKKIVTGDSFAVFVFVLLESNMIVQQHCDTVEKNNMY